MDTTRTLLAPTDFSEPSLEALREAVALAASKDAELVLLHVQQEAEVPVWHVLQTSGFPNPHEEIRKGVLRHLEELQREVVPANVRSRLLLREGFPAAEIVAAAAELDVDMIVTATHGRSGFKRFLLGSTAERVIRTAGCPVLVVRGRKGAEERGRGYRKILVTTDFSERSKVAFPGAAVLAEESQGTVFLLHVVQPLPWPASEALQGDTNRVVREALRKEAMDRLAKLRAAEIPGHVRCEIHVLEGSPEEEIVRFATEQDIDLISIASEGHSGFKRLLLGSTTERVAQAAPCSVLVARKLSEPADVATRREYVHKTQAMLERLQVKASLAKLELREVRGDLLKRYDAARNRLRELGETTGDRWDAMKVAFESAWGAFKERYESVMARHRQEHEEGD